MDVARLEVDLHLLELRFAGARLIEPQAVEKLARSIERDGQIVPCIVVGSSLDCSEAKDGERLVLIDGYRRGGGGLRGWRGRAVGLGGGGGVWGGFFGVVGGPARRC